MEKKNSEYKPELMAKFGWKVAGQHDRLHHRRGHRYTRVEYEYERPETFKNSAELKELEQEYFNVLNHIYWFESTRKRKLRKLEERINSLQ